MNIEIKKISTFDIKKVVYEMNKIFVHTKKNKNFIIWQYFKNIYKSSLFKITYQNEFAGISGFQKKILYNNVPAYQYIGLFVIEKFRGKKIIKKSLSLLKEKIFKDNFYFVIVNQNLGKFHNKFFKNVYKKKITCLKIKKKKFKSFILNKNKNDFYFSKDVNMFKKTKKHFFWRYNSHPLYN